MTASYVSVPEVKAYLHDTLLPAAIASLSATITVAGQSVKLRKPDLVYGKWPGQAPPPSYLMIGPTSTGAELPAAVFPSGSGQPWHDEAYTIDLLVWYQVGDAGVYGQRIATESAYAVFRAIAAQVESATTRTGLGAIIGNGGRVILRAVSDSEFDAAEGRACGLACSLDIKSRIPTT